MTAQDQQSHAPAEQWKCGNEFLPYHPSTSHVEPAYRDGWNACFKAAAQVQAMLAHRGVGNEEKPAQTRMDAGSPPGPELPSGWQAVPTTEPQAPTTGAGSVTAGAAQQLIVGPCGQCKDDRDPCSCAIDTMLKERGQIAVNRERHLAMAKQAKAAQERKPLTDEQVQDLIGFGDPTEQECYLVRLGWSAANAIT